jgi:hypothetical protein
MEKETQKFKLSLTEFERCIQIQSEIMLLRREKKLKIRKAIIDGSSQGFSQDRLAILLGVGKIDVNKVLTEK